DEQIAWAVDTGVDLVIGETFSWWEEAAIALDAILAAGLPAVVTIAMHQEPVTRDGLTPEEACRRLEEAGATVVGLNCIRGPRPHHIRAVAEAAGREPPASRYSPDMSKHAFLGTNASLNPEYQGYAERL